MNSLWLKLMGAFVLTLLVGIGLVVFFISQATRDQFELYMTTTGQQQAAQLAPVAADYYARYGSWQGVEEVLRNPWNYGMNMGRMQGENHGGHGMMEHLNLLSTNRILVANAQGVVVVDTAGNWLNQSLSASELASGTPIMGASTQLGTLIITPLDTPTTPAGDFLVAIQQAALLAALVASSLALGLGSIWFRQMMRPLRHLASAAQGIATGDLTQRVQVVRHDEIGQVAHAFNQMATALERYAEERRNMIGDVAHDLRTPLAILQSNLEAMLDGVLPTTPEELTLLHQETLLLNRLITDLRTLSLAESGQLLLHKRPVAMDALLQQVVTRMQRRADEQQITLTTEIAPDLPQLEADTERLLQVLTNLVENALRYSTAGNLIVLRATIKTPYLCLSVTDNGVGIAPEDLPHVFERFWRAEKSRNRATGGSGLGLTIAKQLVEAHQGKLEVTSQVGQGTCFTVSLPLH